MTKYLTSPEPLEISSVDIPLRCHPLSADDAIDEALGVGHRLEESGALTLLIESGSGVGFNPSQWDLSDVALLTKAIVRATSIADGSSDDDISTSPKKPSAIFNEICARYGVQVREEDSWIDLADASPNALPPDVKVMAVFACLRGSLAPFFARLKLLAEEKAVEPEKLSGENAPTD